MLSDASAPTSGLISVESRGIRVNNALVMLSWRTSYPGQHRMWELIHGCHPDQVSVGVGRNEGTSERGVFGFQHNGDVSCLPFGESCVNGLCTAQYGEADLARSRRILGNRLSVHANGDDQWVEADLRYRELDDVRQILGFATSVEVISPPEARHRLTELAREILHHYGERALFDPTSLLSGPVGGAVVVSVSFGG